ncbi:MAG: sulfurtransferase [Proteobacteria bacterium]|nr:sulfurtransferase [Pseudomonadota bacterium]
MTDKRILIVANELSESLDEPGLVVLDCRFDLGDPAAGRRSFLERHIAGARFIDLDDDLAGPVSARTGRHPLPDVDTIAARLGRLGVDNASRIVVYDGSSGAMAARAWWILRWLGHDEVRLLDGGFARWQTLGLPVDTGESQSAATRFEPRLRPELVLTTRELAGDLEGIGGRRLLDARDRARYRGEMEPVDAVAGHVPGAVNLPFTEFLNEDGSWRSREERARRMRDVLGDDPGVPWSVMCGSGVTACHLAIAGLEAGYGEPRLYVGSWSEWIRDPERPVGLGDAV